MKISIDIYSSLLETLYAALLDDNPLQQMLAPLRQAIVADTCHLMLRWPSELGTSLILADGLINNELAGPDNPYSKSGYKLDPFTGGYYDNIDFDGDEAAGNYGPAYQRLREIKAQYDPGNQFRMNSNIEPA